MRTAPCTTAARGDGHRDVEEVRAERVRVADARRDAARERRRDLRPRGEVPRHARAPESTTRDSLPVDDHDAPAGVRARSGPRARASGGEAPAAPAERPPRASRSRPRRARPSRSGRCARCARTRPRAAPRARARTSSASAEVAEEEPAAHGAGRRRKPTPRTVSIQPGSPSLRRSEPTWTSIVFVWPYQFVSQTCASSCCRVTTAPGSSASAARRSNSLAVSASSAPSSATRGARGRRPRARRRAAGLAARRGLGAPRHGVDAGDQLAQAERLDDVVVGAELEADDPVDLLARGR